MTRYSHDRAEQVIDYATRIADPKTVTDRLFVAETALRLIACGRHGKPQRMSREASQDVATRACVFLNLDTAMKTVRSELYGIVPNEDR